MNYLWKALTNMHSLHDSDLRLKSNFFKFNIVVGHWIALNNTLWSILSTFRSSQLTDDQDTAVNIVKVIFNHNSDAFGHLSKIQESNQIADIWVI